MATVRTQRQWRDHLAAHFVELLFAKQRAGRAGHGLKTGRQIDGRGTQADTGGKAAKPGQAADALAKIGDQFHRVRPFAQTRAPVLRRLGYRRPGDRIGQPQRHGRAALLRSKLAFLKQTRDPQGIFSLRPQRPRAPCVERDCCERPRLKSI